VLLLARCRIDAARPAHTKGVTDVSSAVKTSPREVYDCIGWRGLTRGAYKRATHYYYYRP